MDKALDVLSSHREEWAGLSLDNRIGLIDQLITGFFRQADNWVSLDLKAKNALGNKYVTGFEWMGSPVAMIRTLQGLRQTLTDLSIYGQPRIPGPVRTRRDGQVIARVFPAKLADRILFSGYTCEVWMEPDVSLDELAGSLAPAYQQRANTGKVALVLGAGNSSGLPATDVLYKLLVDKQVVLLKMSPVNEYLVPVFAEGFRSMVEAGFLQIVYGGASEGKYLCHHPAVDESLLTGSHKTFEAIVFGEGLTASAVKPRVGLFLRSVSQESWETWVPLSWYPDHGGKVTLPITPNILSPNSLIMQAITAIEFG